MTGDDELVDGYPHELVGAPADPPVDPPARVVELARRAAARSAPGLDEPLVAAAGEWRPARSLVTLRSEADAASPGRDKSSDGMIGDSRHDPRSDHRPWVKDNRGMGVVRAADLDASDLPMAAAVERARRKAHAGELPQLVGGGYVIYARRITLPDFSGWAEYHGENPHVLHGHFSVSRAQARYDSGEHWGIFVEHREPAPRRPAPRRPSGHDLRGSGLTLRGEQGDAGVRVGRLQAALRRRYPLYAGDLVVDHDWGGKTSAALAEFAHRSRIPEADGRNIGPKLARALLAAGIRP